MSKLRRTIKRLQNPRDLKLFLQILLMLTFLPGKIRRHSMPDLLGQLDPGVAPTPRDQDRLMKTVGFTDSLLRYRVFQRYGKCLLRSLILFHFLRSQGWPVAIHFGVWKSGESDGDSNREDAANRMDITGHSWLILEGKAFLEDEVHALNYTTTYKYPYILSITYWFIPQFFRGRIQLPSTTVNRVDVLKNTSYGVLNPSFFLGR